MKSTIAFVVMALVFVACSKGAKLGDAEYSADIEFRVGPQAMDSKIQVAKDKIRLDAEGISTIIRYDKNEAWMLMHGTKTYFKRPLEAADRAMAMKDGEGVTREKVGVEEINGIKADKYKVKVETPEGEMVSFQWIDPSYGIPVKVEDEQAMYSMAYRNIARGTPAADVFELPSGYTEVTLPVVNPPADDVVDKNKP